MSAPQIILLAYFAYAAIVNILLIGKERKPFTPVQAAFALVLCGVLSTLVVFA